MEREYDFGKTEDVKWYDVTRISSCFNTLQTWEPISRLDQFVNCCCGILTQKSDSTSKALVTSPPSKLLFLQLLFANDYHDTISSLVWKKCDSNPTFVFSNMKTVFKIHSNAVFFWHYPLKDLADYIFRLRLLHCFYDLLHKMEKLLIQTLIG